MNVPITEHQAQVSSRALDEEEAQRRHICIALTGAHAYGFPSPDSDLDLKGVHITPTRELVGLGRPAQHASRLEVVDGVEIDYASNEIGQVLSGLLAGYGSYFERLLGMWTLRTTPAHEELRPLVVRSLSRRVHAHYRGFAGGQHREASAAQAPTAKKLLYVLRTALTGAHLLASGKLVTDLTALMDDYGFAAARELLDRKRQGERIPLEPAMAAHWLVESRRALEALDAARASSPLPEEPTTRADLDAWLVSLRRAHFD